MFIHPDLARDTQQQQAEERRQAKKDAAGGEHDAALPAPLHRQTEKHQQDPDCRTETISHHRIPRRHSSTGRNNQPPLEIRGPLRWRWRWRRLASGSRRRRRWNSHGRGSVRRGSSTCNCARLPETRISRVPLESCTSRRPSSCVAPCPVNTSVPVASCRSMSCSRGRFRLQAYLYDPETVFIGGSDAISIPWPLNVPSARRFVIRSAPDPDVSSTDSVSILPPRKSIVRAFAV